MNSRLPWGWLLAFPLVAGPVAVQGDTAAVVSPDAVQLAYQDVDGDGEAEIIFENEYLRVELTTGVPPVNAVTGRPQEQGWLDRLRRKRAVAPAIPPKYGTRFVWAGWIHNITFRPTNQRWFLDDREHQWHGIPEEFEQAVAMRETGAGEFDVLKVGVGVCRGKGICHSGGLTLIQPAPWTHEVMTTPAGGKRVVFRQTISTEFGYGYAYEKDVTLEPGEARLVVGQRLQNTGTQPLRTTWYTHAFWAQAAEGDGYDTTSWSTIPLRYAGDGPLAGLVDTEACLLSKPWPHWYWGAIPGTAIPESWSASGNQKTGDVFVTQLDVPLAWDRVWTYETTYSCEPFALIEVEPGKTKEWGIVRTVGNGLSRVRGPGAGGSLNWEFVPSKSGAGRYDLAVEFLPARRQADVQIECQLEPKSVGAGSGLRQAVSIPACGPTQVFAHTFGPIGGDGLYEVHATVRAGEVVLADVTRLCAPGDGVPSARWTGNAGGAGALILSDVPQEAPGKPAALGRAAAYLKEYLSEAGFTVAVADPGPAAGSEPGWATNRLVVIAGLTRFPGYLRPWLEGFVGRGNGVVFCGPVPVAAFEFSPLLPVQRCVGEVHLSGLVTRDGTREFVGASRQRYQLRVEKAHPIVQGLATYPEVCQDVTSLQLLEPKADGQVLLRYVPGEMACAQVSTPALVVGTYGQGRVAVFASPVDWGQPACWVIWSRLAEYHRKFFAQMGLWAAGAVP